MGGLSVNDGFKFGCGFFLAGFIAWIVMVLIILVLSLLSGAALGNLWKGLEPSGSLLPLLGLV